MKKTASRMCFMLACAASSLAFAAPAQHDGQVAEQSPIYATVSRLDTGLFDSFNHCSSPAQLKKHASYLAPNLEFYHDKGGVTWTRRDYMAKTGRNVCGHYRRVLIAGSLQVFPVKDYGAIEQGRHKFCEIESGKCFGVAQFLILWHHLPDKWVATRIFSYGHEAIQPDAHSKTH